ncbi:MAG: PIG-L deacetylase family protein [Desulfitobacteriaceae bacterium]
MPNRLLLIFAHPDDESFATAGIISKYAEQGTEVILVSATKGEAGRTAGLCAPEELGSVREKELKRAAEILGIAKVIFLGYRDKEVPAAPPLEILTKLVGIIRELRPQVLVTFGEDGGSGHQDHRAVHHFVKAAVRLAAQSTDLEWGQPFTLPRLFYVQAVWRQPKDKVPRGGLRVPTKVWSERKWQAICAHATQIFSRQRFENMSEAQKERYFSHEYFVCDPELSLSKVEGEDLFQGLEGVDD